MIMSKKPYRLVEEKLPAVKRAMGKRGSKYDPIIDEFLESASNVVRVEYPDIKPKVLSAGLKTRIRHREIREVNVKTRRDNVYLTKA